MRDRTEEALNALAKEIRADVARQVHDAILETPAMGSQQLVAARLRHVLDAEKHDRSMLRPATMDLAVGAAVWTVSLDLIASRYKVTPLGTDVPTEGNGDGPLGR